jgi:hypothetical protein
MVYGEQVCGNVALLAAALDDRIRAVATTGALLSYRPAMQEFRGQGRKWDWRASALDTGRARVHFSLFVPGLLKLADLPEIHGLIAPRKILAANPLEPDDFEDIRSKIPGILIKTGLTEPAPWLAAALADVV